MPDKLQVLILCTANSARSQMGEGLLRHLGGDKVDVYSAAEACPVFLGPAERIHWSYSDPAAVTGDEPALLMAFVDVRKGLEQKLSARLNSHNRLK